MKSYVLELSRVAECLLRDAAAAYPDLAAEFEKDLIRLRALVKARGLALFTLDLPATAKHLDRCLSSGQYTASGLPATRRVSRRVAVPRFLRGLHLLVFDERGCLRSDCDVTAVFFIRQILLVGKKCTVACSDQAVEEEIHNFLAVDESLSSAPEGWQGDDPFAVLGRHLFVRDALYRTKREAHPADSRVRMFDLMVNLDRMSGLMCSLLGDYTPSVGSTRHGPGAVAERTGVVNKYHFGNWSNRLETVFPYADFAYHGWSAWADSVTQDRDMVSKLVPPYREVTGLEAPSRLVAVPKTVDKPRLIAAEPTEHQWCQQSIWRHLAARVEHSVLGSFLDFHSQEINQTLCLRSSADGRLATLDLSSASDRVTCRVVQSLFWRLPGLLTALHATRTRWVEVPLRGGFCCKLKKFATMGSACTFPVESLIFLAVALAAVVTTRRLRVTQEALESLIGEVAVFGDDIIVPEDSRELCVQALELLEFKINERKSFTEGNFRESCGVDAFRGTQVTPAYWMGPNTGKPESVASTVAVHNNFLQKGLWHTARYLASTVRRGEAPFVSANSGVFGLKTHVLPDPRFLYRSRWNGELQRFEVLVPQLVVAASKTAIEDDSALLQYFTEKPSRLTSWRSGVAQRPRLRLKARWVACHRIAAQAT